MKELMLILTNFVKKPKETGAVAPSSRFLTKEIISSIEFESSENIIELGPGLGTFTKEILKKAKPSAKMFCFEVNKGFCSYLNENINDSRMTVINKGAESISAHLKKFKLGKADCIVSGLPFLSFDDSKREKILNEVK